MDEEMDVEQCSSVTLRGFSVSAASLHACKSCPTRAGLLSRIRDIVISATLSTDLSQCSLSWERERERSEKEMCHLSTNIKLHTNKTATHHFAHYVILLPESCSKRTETFCSLVTTLFESSKCLSEQHTVRLSSRLKPVNKVKPHSCCSFVVMAKVCQRPVRSEVNTPAASRTSLTNQCRGSLWFETVQISSHFLILGAELPTRLLSCFDL